MILLLASFCHWTAVCRSSQRSMTVFRNFKNQSQRFMTIFRNFKNHSQRFMTIFRNFKNQSQRFMIRIKTLRYFRVRFSALESKTKIAHNKMDKKRLRVALKEAMEQECLKEKITVEEVIFLTILEVKSYPRKNIFYFVVSTLRDIVLS